MDSEELHLDTSGQRYVDLTEAVARFVSKRGDGLCSVFVPHATAGVAVFEVGAGSERDLTSVLDVLFPRDGRWAHSHSSPGHGADHVLPAFISPSLTLPVLNGRPALGTWQSVVLVDTNEDNPHRTVRLSFLPG